MSTRKEVEKLEGGLGINKEGLIYKLDSQITWNL